MDCRIYLIVGLGLGVLGGGTGCTPSFFSRSSGTDTPQSTSRKEPAPAPPPATTTAKKEKEKTKRKPKVSTCVAFGDLRMRQSMEQGRTLQEQRQMREEARRAYQQALQVDPSCLEAHRGLANLYLAEKDEEAALRVYQGAVKARPREASLWYDLGMLHSRRKEWELAIDALGVAADIDPDNRTYASTLGFCLARAGRFEDSLNFFARVVGPARAHYNVGRMMLHVGQASEGKRLVQLAVQMDPNLNEARDLLTRLEGQGDQGIVPVSYTDPVRQ